MNPPLDLASLGWQRSSQDPPCHQILTLILAWLALATSDNPPLPRSRLTPITSDDAPPPGDLWGCRPQPSGPRARSQTR
ncbi:hypothetical protein TIFTF001_001572 [Ficus carica]|uniref:Uncharacterized protein n=1 Tax=Ficus carica TaxID=3494 RepID=A0AA87Z0S2_FICCA|nr:hypothetical protein TIFTF001_001572 [Ficus carica]